jgi:hypothetical protein
VLRRHFRPPITQRPGLPAECQMCSRTGYRSCKRYNLNNQGGIRSSAYYATPVRRRV